MGSLDEWFSTIYLICTFVCKSKFVIHWQIRMCVCVCVSFVSKQFFILSHAVCIYSQKRLISASNGPLECWLTFLFPFLVFPSCQGSNGKNSCSRSQSSPCLLWQSKEYYWASAGEFLIPRTILNSNHVTLVSFFHVLISAQC